MARLHNIIYILWILLLAMTLLPLPDKALSAGIATVIPRAGLSAQVDSNFFKAQDEKRQVLTWLAEPGLTLEYQTLKTETLVDYTAQAFWYEDLDTVPKGEPKASEDDYLGHRLDAKFQATLFPKLTFRVYEYYRLTRDPAQSDIYSDSISRDKYWINRLSPVIFYDATRRIGFQIRYRNEQLGYLENDRRPDHQEHRAYLHMYYYLSQKTFLDAEFQRWHRDYKAEVSDYTSDLYRLTFRRQFLYLALEVGAGYTMRDFKDPFLRGIDAWVYRLALSGQKPALPEKKPRSKMILALDQNVNDEGRGAGYYTARRLSFEGFHIWAERFIASTKIYYQNSDFTRTLGLTPDGRLELRNDYTFYGQAGLGYEVKDWVTFSLVGGYEQRDSNIEGHDFNNAFGMIKADFAYEFGKGY